MKSNIPFVLIAIAGLSARGQNVGTATPSFNHVAAQAAETPAAATSLPAPAMANDAKSDDNVMFVPKLAGVVVYGNRDSVKAEEGITNFSGVRVDGVSFVTTKEVAAIVNPYLGKPATKGSVRAIERDLIRLSRKNDHPVVDVTLPEQNVDSGVIQLVILEGKVGKVIVEHTGRTWFSTNYTRNNIRLQPGDSIKESKLIDDINWLKQDPSFRDVNVAFRQGGLGSTADVVVQEQDHFPLEANIGFDNAGVKIVGQDRVTGGLTWANVFGTSQKLDYEYTTDTDFNYLRAHSAIWTIPLPWRNTLTIFGSYANMTSDFKAIGIQDGPDEKGVNDQLSVRYAIPLPRLGRYTHELSLGFDYKYANNNLNFGSGFGPSGLIDFPTEIEQFTGAYRAILPYSIGQTSLDAEGFYSPGDWSSVNTSGAFNLARAGATADYWYAKGSLEQLVNLPADFSFDVRGTVQWADANLLPSEEFTLGGVETVRGYYERTANGDKGFLVNTELRSPSIALGSLFNSSIPDTLQFIAFCDYGYVEVDKGPALTGYEYDNKLASVGGGIRYNLNKYLAVRLDYGYQLIRDAALLSQAGYNSGPWMGHISVVARF